MNPSDFTLLITLIAAVAVLYSCVGHGGASGYIAIMMFFGLMPAIIKPTALVLNILVSSTAAFQFYKAGYFRWSLFWPFACMSIPFAYVGGHLTLPVEIYRVAVGIMLLFSAVRLLIRAPSQNNEIRRPSYVISLFVGAILGLISGLIGVGGGIFLSPLLILAGWAGIKETSAVASLFVLVNSVSGLLGHMNAVQNIPPMALVVAAAAVCGGITGSYFGSKRLPLLAVQRALSMVLCIAGYKLIFV